MAEESHDQHAERIARNEALFREVNERLRDVNEPFSDVVPAPDWVCECADPACIEKISLSMEEYEALRAEPTHFAVAPNPGHVSFEVDNVVGQTERYWIVEKIGAAAEVSSEEQHEGPPDEREPKGSVD
jgi:hypothetical protein